MRALLYEARRARRFASGGYGAYVHFVVRLNPTPPERLLDAQGRPYFQWDVDMGLDAFKAKLESSDDGVRAYWIGKLMREARPDDVFQFVSLQRIYADWCPIERYLGRRREDWAWLLDQWRGAAR